MKYSTETPTPANKIPFILILAACLPRFIVFFLAYLRPQACLVPDSAGYLALSKSLWMSHAFTQGGSPETFRVPGYPIFLIPFTRFFTSPELWIAFTQCLLGVMTVFIMWIWLRQLTDHRGALAGALVIALDLIIVFHTPMVLAETLVMFVEVLALIQTWHALKSPGRYDVFFCGVLWGLAMLIKPVFLFFPLVLCWAWAPQKKLILTCLLGAYLMPAGWIARNGLETHVWGLTSQAGFDLLKSPAAGLIAMDTGRTWEPVLYELKAQVDASHPSGYQNESEQSQAYLQAAVKIIRQHPVLLGRYCLTGATRMLAGTGVSLWFLYPPFPPQPVHGWSLHLNDPETRALLRTHFWLIPIQVIYALGLGCLYVLAVRGWIQLWRQQRKAEAYLLVVGAVYFLGIACHQGYSRFRIPMMPFLAGAFAIAATRPETRKNV